MIIYATKQTIERYKLKLPDEFDFPMRQIVKTIIKKESGNRLLEWGAKIFYWDKRKCLQLVNFASKFTLYLVDIKMSDKKDICQMMANYIFELYKDDKQMVDALQNMFIASQDSCFDKLIDKSIIATLSTNQRVYLDDGYRLYDFVRDGILHTIDINRNMNFKYILTTTINKKTEYIYPAEKFRELVLERYGNLKTMIR